MQQLRSKIKKKKTSPWKVALRLQASYLSLSLFVCLFSPISSSLFSSLPSVFLCVGVVCCVSILCMCTSLLCLNVFLYKCVRRVDHTLIWSVCGEREVGEERRERRRTQREDKKKTEREVITYETVMPSGKFSIANTATKHTFNQTHRHKQKQISHKHRRRQKTKRQHRQQTDRQTKRQRKSDQ